MEFRRRWSAMAVVAVVATTGGRAGFGATPAPLNPAVAAAALSSAKGQAAVDLGNEINAYVDSFKSATDKDDTGKKFAEKLLPLTKGKNPDAQLVAAITIAHLHILSADHALVDMLSNPNAGVRYWAAKGLSEVPDLKAVNPTHDIAELKKALAVETSGIVKKEMMRTLGELGLVMDVVEGLEAMEATLVTTTPDQETLETMSIGLSNLDDMIKKTGIPDSPPGKAANTARIAKAADWTASLVAQQLLNLSDAKKPRAGALPDGYQSNAVNVINNGMKVLNSASGKSEFLAVAPETAPDDLKLKMDGVSGSATLGGGQVQKVFTGVPVPPVIKPAK